MNKTIVKHKSYSLCFIIALYSVIEKVILVHVQITQTPASVTVSILHQSLSSASRSSSKNITVKSKALTDTTTLKIVSKQFLVGLRRLFWRQSVSERLEIGLWIGLRQETAAFFFKAMQKQWKTK